MWSILVQAACVHRRPLQKGFGGRIVILSLLYCCCRLRRRRPGLRYERRKLEQHALVLRCLCIKWLAAFYGFEEQTRAKWLKNIPWN